MDGIGKTASENQEMFSCLEHARLIWIRSANSHTGPQHSMLHHEAGQMAASDQVRLYPNYRLRSLGRPQKNIWSPQHVGQGFGLDSLAVTGTADLLRLTSPFLPDSERWPLIQVLSMALLLVAPPTTLSRFVQKRLYWPEGL